MTISEALRERLIGAVVQDMRRFQRAAGEADKLHQPDNGKCREDRKPWPCPTRKALDSGLYWDGREDPVPVEGEAAVQARRDAAHVDGPCRCYAGEGDKRQAEEAAG